MVDQTVEQVGAHAYLLLLHARQEAFFGLAFHRNRRGQRCRFHRYFGDRADIGVAGRGGIAATGTGFEGFHQIGRHRHGAVLAGAGQQLVQAIKAALEQTHVVAVDVGPVGRYGFKQRFDRVTEVADGVDAGHARTALERVQIALQSVEDIAVFRHFAHAGDQAIAMVQQVAAFFDEDVDQLAVELIEVERADIECRTRVVARRLDRRGLFHRCAEGCSGVGVFRLCCAVVGCGAIAGGCAVLCGVVGVLVGNGVFASVRMFLMFLMFCVFCVLDVLGCGNRVGRCMRVGMRRVFGG